MKFKNILSQIFNGLKKISYQWQIYRDKSFASSILKFFPKNFLLVIFLNIIMLFFLYYLYYLFCSYAKVLPFTALSKCQISLILC